MKANTKNTISSASFQMPIWLPLSLILVAIILLRLQYLDIPLERDESLYAYIGKLALSGGKPYYDFYEMKPPMLFYSYALLIGIFGYSATGIHLAVIAVTIINTCFIFQIARKIGGLQVAYLSIIVYGLWSLFPGNYGVYLMSENVALIWGLPALLLALNNPNKLSNKQLLAIGILLSLSFLVKQTAGIFAVTVGLYWLTIWFAERKTTAFLSFFKPIIWTALGFFVPLILTFIGLWVIGTLEEAKYWLFEYSNFYATAVTNEDAKIAFDIMQKLVITGYEGYFLLSFLGIFIVMASKKELSIKVFIISWAILALLTVAMGKRFYGHYFHLALPIMSILGVLFFSEISLFLRQKKGRIEGVIVLILCALWSVHALFIQHNIYFEPELNDISRKYCAGNPYIEDQLLSNYIKKFIKPTDQVAMFGCDTQFFIYLNKISPIRHVYMPFLVKDKLEKSIAWRKEIIKDLENKKPEYVILNVYPFAWLFQPDSDQQLFKDIYAHLMNHYDLVAFIENPVTNKQIQIKEPVNGSKVVAANEYISVLKLK